MHYLMIAQKAGIDPARINDLDYVKKLGQARPHDPYLAFICDRAERIGWVHMRLNTLLQQCTEQQSLDIVNRELTKYHDVEENTVRGTGLSEIEALTYALKQIAAFMVPDELDLQCSDCDSYNITCTIKYLPCPSSELIPFCLKLGELYEAGSDKSEAVKWYQKAARQGDLEAQYRLAGCYRDGTGVKMNPSAAFTLYLKTAKQGYLDSLDQVGQCYLFGTGVEKDLVAARNWLEMAATKGHVLAMIHMARLCLEETPNSKACGSALTEAGREWKEKALQQGKKAKDPQSLRTAAAQLRHFPFYDRVSYAAFEEAAAELGDSNAQYRCGEAYEEGIGVKKNPEIAFEWYLKAAEQGHPGAENMVGRFLKNGWAGIPVNKEEATKWYRRAAEHGHSSGQYNLAICLANGEGVSQDKKEHSCNS